MSNATSTPAGRGSRNVRYQAVFVVALVAMALLGGCATGEKMGQLQPGMSHAEVRSILGDPDGFRTVGAYEVYQYSNRATSGWSYDRADYNVVFLNGRVVEYGVGEVRPGVRPNTVIIIPFTRQ